jgi:5-methylthioadenosine/S-adenosylhomocysteine deaminase
MNYRKIHLVKLLAGALVFALTACSPANEAGSAESDHPGIDLIIEGSYIVTMDVDGTVYENGAVAIDEGLIIAIGPSAEINAEYSAAQTLGGESRIVLPGLINGHSHAAMTLLRGVADDLALMDWLNNYIFPAEVEFVDTEFVRIGTELACWEMIRGGTTTFVDMYYFPDTIAEIVDSCGMRAMISATVIDQRSPDAENAVDSIQKGNGFIERWKGKNSRISPIFGPHANYTLNAEQLKATRQAAMELVRVAVLARHLRYAEHRAVRIHRLLRGPDDRRACRLAHQGGNSNPGRAQGRRDS